MKTLQIIIKRTIFFICTAASLPALAQQAPSGLAGVHNVEDANKFINANKAASAELITISSNSDTSAILLPLFSKKAGHVFFLDDYYYKIVQLDSALMFRVNYIYLDGNTFSKAAADSIRQVIIQRYKNGTSFFELVPEYTMDMNTSGDTGWFPEKMMAPTFEKAVKAHKKNDVFTVDTPDYNWYHVVLKTFDDTFVKKVTLVKVKRKK